MHLRNYKGKIVYINEKNYPSEKCYRDSKICTIGEETKKIKKIVISRDILGKT